MGVPGVAPGVQRGLASPLPTPNLEESFQVPPTWGAPNNLPGGLGATPQMRDWLSRFLGPRLLRGAAGRAHVARVLPAPQTSHDQASPSPTRPETPVSSGRGGGDRGVPAGTPHPQVLQVWGLRPELKDTEQRPVAKAWLCRTGSREASAAAGRGSGRKVEGQPRGESPSRNWWCKQGSVPLTRGETESQRRARLTCQEGGAPVTLGAPRGRACVTGPRVGISASCSLARLPELLWLPLTLEPGLGSWGLLPGPASRGPWQRPRPAAVAGPESPSVSQSASCLVLVSILVGVPDSWSYTVTGRSGE